MDNELKGFLKEFLVIAERITRALEMNISMTAYPGQPTLDWSLTSKDEGTDASKRKKRPLVKQPPPGVKATTSLADDCKHKWKTPKGVLTCTKCRVKGKKLEYVFPEKDYIRVQIWNYETKEWEDIG